MFSFFRKKTPQELLQKEYDLLMQEAYRLSKTNRTASDQKTMEANEILNKINELIAKP